MFNLNNLFGGYICYGKNVTNSSSLCIENMLAAAAVAKSLQSCLTLCDPVGGSPLGSPAPGILQATTLEWLPFPSPMHESEK